MTTTLSDMRSFDAIELDAISSQASTLEQGAQGSERLTAVIVLLLLLVVLVITIVVARSMILPLRRLRADALDVAGRRLPDMVRRLSRERGARARASRSSPSASTPPTRSARSPARSTRCTARPCGWPPKRPCCGRT